MINTGDKVHFTQESIDAFVELRERHFTVDVLGTVKGMWDKYLMVDFGREYALIKGKDWLCEPKDLAKAEV